MFSSYTWISERCYSERVVSVRVPAEPRTTAKSYAIYWCIAGRFFASRRINVIAFGDGDEKSGSTYLYSVPPYNLSLLSWALPLSLLAPFLWSCGWRFLSDAPGHSVLDTIIRAPIIKMFPFEVDIRGDVRASRQSRYEWSFGDGCWWKKANRYASRR